MATNGEVPDRAVPVVDVGAVLADLQEQIDDLTATVHAQQRTIDELLKARQTTARPTVPRGTWPRPAQGQGKAGGS
jgi:hypothetical protein